LEALLEFLRKECNPPVPVARVGIGPIFKKDVTQTGINIEKGGWVGGWVGGSCAP
jgi:translation initiation factor IF-2